MRFTEYTKNIACLVLTVLCPCKMVFRRVCPATLQSIVECTKDSSCSTFQDFSGLSHLVSRKYPTSSMIFKRYDSGVHPGHFHVWGRGLANIIIFFFTSGEEIAYFDKIKNVKKKILIYEQFFFLFKLNKKNISEYQSRNTGK